jgi:hypothetical protein
MPRDSDNAESSTDSIARIHASSLALFVDDCWEPAEAIRILHRLARDSSVAVNEHSHAICLLVPGADPKAAEILTPETVLPAALPSEERRDFLWVLWHGGEPSRSDLLILYDEYRASEPCEEREDPSHEA